MSSFNKEVRKSHDKNNGWIPIEVSYYREKMMDNLNNNCVKINAEYLERVEAKALILFQDYKPFMDKWEQGYIESWIKSRGASWYQQRITRNILPRWGTRL